MVIRKDKQNKIAARPSRRREDIAIRRPFDLWNEMDGLFENFRSSFDELFWPWEQHDNQIAMTSRQRTPLTDLADHGNRYEMCLEMPGIPKDDINIEITPNKIEISAKYEKNGEGKNKNWLRRERSSLSYYRAFEFPEEIRTNDVEAELNEGILTITLPKVEPKAEFKATKVKIK